MIRSWWHTVRRHTVERGTVYRSDGKTAYWICVTCDRKWPQ